MQLYQQKSKVTEYMWVKFIYKKYKICYRMKHAVIANFNNELQRTRCHTKYTKNTLLVLLEKNSAKKQVYEGGL